MKVLPVFIQNEVDVIIMKNLYKGKESRWLLKNTLLSHDFVSKTLTTTNLKRLYNNHTININSKTKNLWVSNRLKRTKDCVSTTLIENNIYSPTLKNSFLSKPHLSYLDKIESGFYWLLNRFKFFQTSSTYQYFHQKLNTLYFFEKNRIIENMLFFK